MTFLPVLPLVLVLLICAPFAVVAVLQLVRGSRSTGGGAGARTAVGQRMLWAARLLLVLACCALLLRPGIPGGAAQTLATDTDVVLVVDTTASIVAEDWDGEQPRLTGVRQDIQSVVDEYPGARFALISFDAAATLRLPLTTDATALVSSLEVMRPEVTAQSRGSSIGIAHDLLAETLRKAAENSPDRARMVFYFGDGEQTVSTDPESFTESAAYVDGGAVLGYGTAEGGPMRTTSLGDQGGEYIQYQGENALSVLDAENLQTIADELGVEYAQRSAEGAVALPEAPATTSDFTDSGRVGDRIELYWIAALVVLVLLGVELAVAAARVMALRGLTAPRARPRTQPPTEPPTTGGPS